MQHEPPPEQTTLSGGLPRTMIKTLRAFFALQEVHRRHILSELGVARGGTAGSDFEGDRAALLALKDEGRLDELARKVVLDTFLAGY